MIGDELAGESMTVPVQTDGASWGAVRLSDLSLAQTAFALGPIKAMASRQPLGVGRESGSVEQDRLNSAMVDRDITGPRPRGPFEKIAPTSTATYPSLWNHDAKTRDPDGLPARLPAPGQVGNGGKGRRCLGHGQPRSCQSLDFRFNSQPLTAAFTERESMGGRAWPNVRFPNSRFDYAFTLWC